MQLVGDVVNGSVLAGTARGDLQRMSTRRHAWTFGAYRTAHCLAVARHHYGEDYEIFPLLRRRYASLTPVLDRLEDEHRAIHDLLQRIDSALVVLVADAPSETTNIDAPPETTNIDAPSETTNITVVLDRLSDISWRT